MGWEPEPRQVTLEIILRFGIPDQVLPMAHSTDSNPAALSIVVADDEASILTFDVLRKLIGMSGT